MREQMIKNLTKAIEQYSQLRQYAGILPKELLDGASKAIDESIPLVGNNVLSLLNSASKKELFGPQNNVHELLSLLTDRANEIDSAFEEVAANTSIIGITVGPHMTAQQIMENTLFWFWAHCDNITMTLTAGRITAENFNNR